TTPGTSDVLEYCAFEPQQRFLAVEAAAVADELPVRADHAVAWEDDRKRVAVHHRADGARRPRPRRAGRELAVRHDFAVRHTRELTQDAPIEIRGQRQVDVKVESLAPAFEVFVQLAARGVDRSRGPQDAHAEDA